MNRALISLKEAEDKNVIDNIALSGTLATHIGKCI